MKKTIFVTGVTGFIGSNLVEALVQKGYNVHALIRKGSYHPIIKGLEIKRIDGDILDYFLLEKAMKSCDIVIHLAALVSFNEKDRKRLYEINVNGTRNMLQAAKKNKIKKFIFVSSASTIGNTSKNKKIMDETTKFIFEKNNYYEHSKYLAEQEVRRFAQTGENAVILNFSTVYGKGDMWGNSGSVINLIQKYPIFFAPSGGCSVIAVQDAVEGIICAMEKGKSGERYILTNENISFKELFELVHSVVKKKKQTFITLPYFCGSLGALFLSTMKSESRIITPHVMLNLFKYRYLDNSKAQAELGWVPRTPLKKAIEDMLKFQKQLKVSLQLLTSTS